MASFKQYTSSGGASEAFSIKTFSSDEIKVYVDNVLKTAATHYNITSYSTNGGTVTWTSGNVPNGPVVRIVRDTGVTTARATYAAGSSIKADDLNDNQTQTLRSLEEQDDQLIQTYDIQDSAITSAKIANGAIVNDDVNASAAIAGTKISPDFGSQNIATTGTVNGVTTTELAILDGATVSTAELNLLDGVTSTTAELNILDGVTATAAELNIIDGVTATTAEINKLDGVTASTAELNILDGVTSTTAEINKLDGVTASTAELNILDGVTATTAEINLIDGVTATTAELNVLDGVTATTAELNLMDGVTATTSELNIVDGVTATTAELNIMDGVTATTAEINLVDGVTATTAELNYVDGVTSNVQTQLDAKQPLDGELTTLAGMQGATASKLASGTALTADIADLNQIDGLTKQAGNTLSDTDSSFPTSGAVVDYVAAQIAPIGGLEVIATDAAFPNTQPSAGVVISIADAGGLVVSSGTSTTARTVGGSTVTINNIASNFNSTTIADGVAMMVSSTGSGQIYNYHKATLKEADLLSLSNDINDFAARYRVASSAPSSSLDEGDLWWDMATDKLKVYDGSSWEEVASSGDFYINTISSYSGTGGNSATFNGSAYRFVLSNPGSSAQQHVVSINGVIQKPNSGTSQPSEGFVIDGSSIIFSNAPATGSDYFILTLGTTVSIGTPSDNTISTAKIQNLAVTGDKIATNLDLSDNKKIRFGTGNDLEIYHSDNNNSYIVNGNGGLHLWGAGDGSNITIRPKSTENSITCTANAEVSLWYDGAKKIETAGGGINVTGDVYCNTDNGSAYFGAGSDLRIYHDGTNSIIKNNTGELKILADEFRINNAANNEQIIASSADGDVELFYNGAKKLETYTSGCYVYGKVALQGSEDGNAIIEMFADEGDDAADKYQLASITNGNWELQNYSSGSSWETNIRATGGGAVSLFYNDAKKFETDPNGVLQGDNSWHYWGDSDDLYIGHNGTNSYIVNTTGNLEIQNSTRTIGLKVDNFHVNSGDDQEAIINGEKDGPARLYYNGVKKLETTANGIKVPDGERVAVGDSQDAYFYHNGAGSDGAISNTVGNFLIYGGGNNIYLRPENTENSLIAKPNGAVELYYDNSKVFETYSSGITVLAGEGLGAQINIYADQGDDNADKWRFDANSSGDFYLQNYAGGSWETNIKTAGGSGVELYYDNAEKFKTRSDGTQHNGKSYFYGHNQGSNAVTTEIWFDSDDSHHGIHFKGQGTTSNTFSAMKFEISGTGGSYGSISYTTSGTAYNSNSSDRRSKKNFEDWTGSVLPDFKAIKPQLFNYTLEEDSVAKHKGYIAQDNVAAFPEAYPLVSDRYQFNPSGMVHYLMKAVQELTEKVETLETKVAALEAK